MQAVVLAAGQGTRMAPLTDNTPKPMLPVAGRPLAAHVADAAVDAGADELVFVVGYEAEDVRSYFGDTHRGVPVTYAVQSKQAGTADALRAARDELEGAFVVLNGDNLYDPAAIDRLFADGPALGTYEVPDPSNYGVVSISDGSITEIVEKPDNPPTDQINAGAYVFPAEAREWLDVPESERGEYEITDVLARVIDDYEVTPVPFERWLDVGRPWELLEANELLLDGIDRDLRGAVSDDVDLRGPVVVEEGATIEPGVVIEGPVYIDAGAEVGPNAYLRGPTYLGEGVHVGNGVEIKNSVIRAGSAVPHLSYVGDSVIGLEVNFGAGTNVANLRHDGADVWVTVKGERVSTGRRKMGVVAGDDVKTGINTSIEPGIVLSSGTHTEPGERVSRDR
ncbi:bifunctional sugar-1-phosphate nucleotidylyltransferase/acetyltransferase [Halorhabdus amylolytica]|uniref:bifunctional sugar-1-phosphate nucleotidylyltransferase/acetyltransferase n=1 Tax=Halorhabdus amylolytica TaxID=2559573 RepID=UPI0010A9C106|nr:bifunctional sugar-1-phosphate nucleotidylyltransferase/acetyltransferase [Halorhabdus amylolytica]